MQITIDQEEITAFVENGIRSQFGFGDNQNISIDFTMGRTPNGLSASLAINAIGAKTASTEPKEVKPVPTTVFAPAKDSPAPVEEAAPQAAEEKAEPVESDPEQEPTAVKKSVFSKTTPAAVEETAEEPAEETKTRPTLFTKAG
tara:strand:- start:2729 stop:3160 length:432 start_codon:yes stop_codon:yes gene_type:complete